MLKNKALIIDLDGTAMDTPDRDMPSARLKSAVQIVQSEYFVCIATGRPWVLVEPIVEFLDIKDPCIVAAGTQIFNTKQSKPDWQVNLNPKSVTALKEALSHIGLRYVANNFTYKEYMDGGEPFANLDTKKTYNYIIALSIKPEDSKEVLYILSKIDGIAYTLGVSLKPGVVDIHISEKSATKEHTVAKLLEEIGVKKENSWGFGDGHNDVHLFNAVGHKIAMGNAVPELKEVADEVIGTVKEDGLAKYFENLAKQL